MKRLATLGSVYLGITLLAVVWLATGGAAPTVAPPAPTAGPSASGHPPARDVFRFAYASMPKTIDPATMTGVPEAVLGEALFEGLLVQRPDGAIEPGVANRYTVSPDGTRYRFTLRDDAYWHGPGADGGRLRQVTADDFIWSWKRVIDPATASEYAYLFDIVVNGENVRKNKGVIGWLGEKRRADGDPGPRDVEVDGRRLLAARSQILGYDPQAFPAAAAAADLTTLKINCWELVRVDLCRSFAIAGPADRPRVTLFGVPDAAALAAALTPGFFALSFDALPEAERPPRPPGSQDRFVEVQLRWAIPYFPDLVAFHTLLPQHPESLERFRDASTGAIGPGWTTEIDRLVTNGPFVLRAWKLNDRITLDRSPTFWARDRVALARAVARILPLAKTQLDEYRAGNLDKVDTFDDTVVEALMTERPQEFHVTPYFGTYYYRINVRRPPFSDPKIGRRLRRALSLAIDRRAICQAKRDHPPPAEGFVPPGCVGYRSLGLLPYDPARARRIFADCGFPRGEGFPALTILYNTSESHQFVAEIVQQQLRRNLGITVELANTEWKVYLARQRTGAYQISRAGWIGDYIDPSTFLEMFVTGGGNNQTGWSNGLYDRLVLDYARSLPRYLGDGPEAIGRIRADLAAYRLAAFGKTAPAGTERAERSASVATDAGGNAAGFSGGPPRAPGPDVRLATWLATLGFVLLSGALLIGPLRRRRVSSVRLALALLAGMALWSIAYGALRLALRPPPAPATAALPASSWLDNQPEMALLADVLDEVARLIAEPEAARRAQEPAIRNALFRWADYVLSYEQAPIIPLYHYNNRLLFRPELQGIELDNPRQHFPLRFLSFASGGER